jgi:hypothetical protein
MPLTQAHDLAMFDLVIGKNPVETGTKTAWAIEI